MPVSFQLRGIDEVEAMLETIPHGCKKLAVQAFTDYLIGDERHGLKHYPPYTTQKIRARTFTLQKGWARSSDEYKPIIKNYTPYAPYVPRWKKYNWRDWMDVIVSNLDGAVKHAQSLVNQYLEKWK
jgi:hypothetical protein